MQLLRDQSATAGRVGGCRTAREIWGRAWPFGHVPRRFTGAATRRSHHCCEYVKVVDNACHQPRGHGVRDTYCVDTLHAVLRTAQLSSICSEKGRVSGNHFRSSVHGDAALAHHRRRVRKGLSHRSLMCCGVPKRRCGERHRASGMHE